MSGSLAVDPKLVESPELSSATDETVEVQWTDPAVFEPALPTRGALAPVRTLMYLAEIPGLLHARPTIKLEINPTEERRVSVFAPLLGLGGVGDTLGQATKDLVTTIESLWASLVEEVPSSLTDDARHLAQRLRSSFRPVTK